MLPRNLTTDMSESERSLYRIVRCDLMTEVEPGSLIVSASVETGECKLKLPPPAEGERDFNFGPDGLKILRR